MNSQWTDPRAITVETVKLRVSANRTIDHHVTRCASVLQIDRLHGAGALDDTQHAAGLRLYGLFIAAGLEPRATARHHVLREEIEDTDAELEVESEYPKIEARIAYRALLRGLRGERGGALDSLMHSTLAISAIPACRDGLDDLAKKWGLTDHTQK